MHDFVIYPSSAATAAAAQAEDEVRAPAVRRIETLTIIVFWLVLLEGAIRKWVLPQYSHALFFIRDPVILLIYWNALQTRIALQPAWLLRIGLGFAIAAIPLALMQVAFSGDSQLALLAAYGWRQYFLCLPLPFIMAATFSAASLRRFMWHATVAVVITAPLMALQFHSAPGAVINRGIAEDESLQFQSFAFTAGLIRPSGTFTSTVGVTELVSSSLALLLGCWLTPSGGHARIGQLTLLVAAAGTAACLAFSGSRAAYVHCAMVVLSALLFGLLARRPSVRGRAILLPAALITAIVVLYPILFPDALAAMISRVDEAGGNQQSQAVLGRALYETVDFVRFMQRAPLIGYGLGLGGNGRSSLTSGDATLFADAYAESDWSRHIVDLGPIVGVFFIMYRIAFTIWLFAQAVHATRTSDSAFPILLFGYIGVGLFYGQLTGHGTVGGFYWLFLGLCMASCSNALHSPPSQLRSPPSNPAWTLMS